MYREVASESFESLRTDRDGPLVAWMHTPQSILDLLCPTLDDVRAKLEELLPDSLDDFKDRYPLIIYDRDIPLPLYDEDEDDIGEDLDIKVDAVRRLVHTVFEEKGFNLLMLRQIEVTRSVLLDGEGFDVPCAWQIPDLSPELAVKRQRQGQKNRFNMEMVPEIFVHSHLVPEVYMHAIPFRPFIQRENYRDFFVGPNLSDERNLYELYKSGEIEQKEALRIAVDAMKGCAHLHDQEWTHGDVRIDNIMTIRNGDAHDGKLYDYDTVRQYGERPSTVGVSWVEREVLDGYEDGSMVINGPWIDVAMFAKWVLLPIFSGDKFEGDLIDDLRQAAGSWDKTGDKIKELKVPDVVRDLLSNMFKDDLFARPSLNECVEVLEEYLAAA